MIKRIIVGLSVFLFSVMLYEVKAGPPKDAQKVIRPYPSICTPTLESILGAMVELSLIHI